MILIRLYHLATCGLHTLSEAHEYILVYNYSNYKNLTKIIPDMKSASSQFDASSQKDQNILVNGLYEREHMRSGGPSL